MITITGSAFQRRSVKADQSVSIDRAFPLHPARIQIMKE